MAGLHVLDTAIDELKGIVNALEQDISGLNTLITSQATDGDMEVYAATVLKALNKKYRLDMDVDNCVVDYIVDGVQLINVVKDFRALLEKRKEALQKAIVTLENPVGFLVREKEEDECHFVHSMDAVVENVRQIVDVDNVGYVPVKVEDVEVYPVFNFQYDVKAEVNVSELDVDELSIRDNRVFVVIYEDLETEFYSLCEAEEYIIELIMEEGAKINEIQLLQREEREYSLRVSDFEVNVSIAR